MSDTLKILETSPQTDDVDIGIEKEGRKTVAKQLSKILTDTYLLTIKTHIYHWNVVGPLFHSIHEMTEEQYEDLFEACDTIAERIRALGFPAPITQNGLLSDGSIQFDAINPSAKQMIDDLITDHETLVRKMRKAAEAAEDDAEDLVTADMLIERLTVHEKYIWMLRALVTE
jgi:starvation-inducible DNA-binding protein